MKSEKIKELHKKHINTLKDRIKELESQNDILNKKNISLKTKLNENDETIKNLSRKLISIQIEYEKMIDDVKELKDEYRQLINKAFNERKKFKKESLAYLKRMKKQN